MGVVEIFKWIYSFEEETKVDLHETASDLKGEVILSKNENGLIFNLGFPDYKLLFQNQTNFIISHNSYKIKSLHFLDKIDRKNWLARYCNVYMFSSLIFNEEEEKYHSYYSKITSSSILAIFIYKLGLKELTISIKNLKFKITTCSINPEIKYNFLCIECDSKISFKLFKHYVNNIIVSLGFITGRFYKNEEFYFQSINLDFSENTNFFYRNSEKKYSFPKPITRTPSEWAWKFKNDFELNEELEQKWSSQVDNSVFSSLVELLIEKPRLYFAIRMLFDFYYTPQISRVSLMFVILETLCEELNTKEFKIEKEFKKENGLLTLKRIKKKISDEDLIILQDIIENIDSKLTNNVVHFEQTIKSLKLNLTNEERKILVNRNEFFHGRIIPVSHKINTEEDYSSLEFKYDYYSLRLYVLVSKILLKKSGFEGYLINYPKLFEENNEMNLKKESYFTKL